MRFCSTPESGREREITLLAIVETLVAISLSLVLLIFFHTGIHIMVGALVAPFLLLTTETSTMNALAMLDSCLSRVPALGSFLNVSGERTVDPKRARLRLSAFVLIWLPLFSILVVVVKFVATLGALLSDPRDTLRAIPSNWLRIALAIDHRHPPEFLAGLDTNAEAPVSLQTLRYRELRTFILSEGGSALAQKLCLLAIYGPAVIYRLFLKSTSLIYFPLIWMTEMPLTPDCVLRVPLERVRRWYAGILLLLMLSPLVIPFRAQTALPNPRDQAIFSYMLPVHRTDWWHVARIVAVAVTAGLYFYARRAHRSDPPNPQLERLIIARASVFRAACGVFTMASFLLIILIL